VTTREKTLLVALLAALAALASPARAQVAAPRMVDEGDEGPPEEPGPPPGRAAPARPQAPSRDPIALPPPPPPSEPPEVAAPPGRPAPAVPAVPGAAPGAGSGTLALPPPPPPPGTSTAAELARRIVPVQASFPKLMALWADRRTALREANPIRAEAAEKALLAVRAELAIDDLFELSAVEVRESRRALDANLVAEATAHARTAVALAPDLPDAHLALARALFAEAPGTPGPAVAAVRDAIAAAAREPHVVRAFYGDLASAGLAAVVVAALATALLLVVRKLRLFLHDFHHLPLLRGTAAIQSGFLALVLLALPVAFGLGPVAAVCVAFLAVWVYLSVAERIVATLAVAALVAVPWATGAAARVTAWTGSLAEVVQQLEHDAVSDQDAAEIAARFADAPAPAPVYAALGRHHKRRGNLDEALRYYRLAEAADGHAPELQVNIGNVLFLKDDLDGAKAAYLAATDRAAGDLVALGAAHYDLSKLYLRTTDMSQSAAAREKAEREAGEFLRRHGSDDDFSANRYLVDVPVPDEKIQLLTASDGAPAALAAWVQRRLGGGVPRAAWPFGPVAFMGALWALALGAGRLRPSRACERCGGAACRRCEPNAGDLCGQCVNVFVRKGIVDARDRLRKEAQVRRRQQFVAVATRILSLVGCGAGQLFHGAPVKGALFLLGTLFAGFLVYFWRGVVPPPLPSPYVLVGKAALAAPLGVAVWLVAIRDAFKRTQ
jgi:tetratricopeptide (TPR) repeat protein